MTGTQFHQRLVAIDRELSARSIPVPGRFVWAWHFFSGETTLRFRSEEPHLGPYEGSNLCHSILRWYKLHYPTHATMGHEWGPRLLVIRGEVFYVQIPAHFNPSGPLDAFRFIQGLSPALRELLDVEESARIQAAYNRLFWQASDLALIWTEWCAPRRHGLASDLIDRGWRDLRASCEAFSDKAPDAVLFTAQQGPEKYLKALLAIHDPKLTEDGLRKAYGHKIPKLLAACTSFVPELSKHSGQIHGLDYGPDVRYHRQAISSREVVRVIDLAHDVCHAAAGHLLAARRTGKYA